MIAGRRNVSDIEEDESMDNRYNSKMTRMNCNRTEIWGIVCVQQQDQLTWTSCFGNWSVALSGF